MAQMIVPNNDPALLAAIPAGGSGDPAIAPIDPSLYAMNDAGQLASKAAIPDYSHKTDAELQAIINKYAPSGAGQAQSVQPANPNLPDYSHMSDDQLNAIVGKYQPQLVDMGTQDGVKVQRLIGVSGNQDNNMSGQAPTPDNTMSPTATGLMKGVFAIPATPNSLLNAGDQLGQQAANWFRDPGNKVPYTPSPLTNWANHHLMTQQEMDAGFQRLNQTNYAKPTTTAGRIYQEVLSAVPSAGIGGLTKIGTMAPEFLASRAGAAAAAKTMAGAAGGGAGAAVGGDVAAQAAPNSPAAALAAQLIGGVAGGAVTEGGIRARNLARSPDPEIAANNMLAQALLNKNAPYTPQDMIAKMQSYSGDNPTIADLGGVPTRNLLRTMSDRGGDAADAVQQDITNRDLGVNPNNPDSSFTTGGANERVENIVKESFGGGDFNQTHDQILANQKAQAAPAYAAFHAEAPLPSDALAEFATRPSFQRGLKQAQADAAEEGKPSVMQYFDQDEHGNVTGVKSAIPTEVLDNIKQGIDKEWLDAKRTGTPSDAARLNNTRRDFVLMLDEAYPNTYAKARGIYAGHAQSLNALEQGADFAKTDSSSVQDMMKNLSPEDQALFRTGAQKSFLEAVRNTPDGANEITRLLGTPEKRAKLQALFPDKESLDNFDNRMSIENAKFKTKTAVLGGPTTAPRLQAQANLEANPVTDAVEIGRHVVDQRYGTAAMALASKIPGVNGLKSRFSGINDDVQQALIEKLLNPNSSANRDTLNAIANVRNSPSFMRQVMANALLGFGPALDYSKKFDMGIQDGIPVTRIAPTAGGSR